MKNRCEGCGAKIQTTDPNKKGFIKSDVYLKNPDNFYCERCFNLIHYNKNTEITYDEKDFLNNVKHISESRSLVVHVVDIFDLDGTMIRNLNQYFPNNRILLVANKFDLFLDSVKIMRVKNYLDHYLLQNDIHVEKSLVLSSFNPKDIEILLNAIYKMQDDQDVYLFGMTNVGKSSIINAISKHYSHNSLITVSNFISTTMDFIKISLPNKTFIIDSPGIINNHQVSYYLEKASLNTLTPKKFIRPATYQINPQQAIMLGGFCMIKFLSGFKSTFVVYVPPKLVVHRTKLENADAFFKEHQDDLLKIPNERERTKMGDLKTQKFIFSEPKKDLYISGLGFVTLIGEGEIEVIYYENIKVGLREAII
ncbi:MAG: ribosome biogenesis GTPase YqeH [Bacilli bacterium]